MPDFYPSSTQNVIVTRHDYRDGQRFDSHRHERGQFAYAACGVITVFTDDGDWVVPPGRAVWVPADLPHAMCMRGPVTMLNAYVLAETGQRLALAGQCQVLEVSELLRQLLAQAAEVGSNGGGNERDSYLLGLLLHEMARMPRLALNAPLPREPRLARICRRLLDQPSLEVAIDDMARDAGMSRRTFTRLFRQHTGVSFVEWRQQACLLAAVVRLGNGEAVTRVALELGYSSPGAFATVFRRALGASPSRYFQQDTPYRFS
ncbi:DNA-binding domain-containing protein, AraC-type [Pseudomonas asplenii]|uniref:DNA-binding domain-containing protein, AraC-type n=1 Tax=Pseudomonas asplenii TaxID=53407 RepID=A0A0M9GIL6_9PSED|nr:helix-turn-helix transcriptional regulator [Pseudomonas fuscovaginae]KPA91825.1 DNA-binding domain-containing protein, AraC-type [Pseudomonas fuscovaginae]